MPRLYSSPLPMSIDRQNRKNGSISIMTRCIFFMVLVFGLCLQTGCGFKGDLIQPKQYSESSKVL